MAAVRVRHAEYVYVNTQAAGKALCPFCNTWHRASDGKAMQGDCVAHYMRHRNVAIVVRGIINRRGAGYQEPSQRDKDRCLTHAVANKQA